MMQALVWTGTLLSTAGDSNISRWPLMHFIMPALSKTSGANHLPRGDCWMGPVAYSFGLSTVWQWC